MQHYCGDLSSFDTDLTEEAVSCESATTPFVRQSLANFMFNHCGSRCLYDFQKPSEISYLWDAHKKCYQQNSHCGGHVMEDLVVHRKKTLCEADLCTPFISELTDSVAARYCTKRENPEYYSAAVGCEDSYTPNVKKSLANNLFHHCGAWCVFDYDEPGKVSYHWKKDKRCYERGDHCNQYAEERASAMKKKENVCKEG